MSADPSGSDPKRTRRRRRLRSGRRSPNSVNARTSSSSSGPRHVLWRVRFRNAREPALVSPDLTAAYKPYIDTCTPHSAPIAGCSRAIPRGWRKFQLPDPMECLQAACRQLLHQREGEAVQRYGEARVPSRLTIPVARLRPVFARQGTPYSARSWSRSVASSRNSAAGPV
jgi:hypothetical protein